MSIPAIRAVSYQICFLKVAKARFSFDFLSSLGYILATSVLVGENSCLLDGSCQGVGQFAATSIAIGSGSCTGGKKLLRVIASTTTIGY